MPKSKKSIFRSSVKVSTNLKRNGIVHSQYVKLAERRKNQRKEELTDKDTVDADERTMRICTVGMTRTTDSCEMGWNGTELIILGNPWKRF
jgi:hypothetical protein